MELKRNGKSTLRISLTPKDLADLKVDPKDLDYELAEGKKVILELFDRACKETGFDAQREKVYIQLYPKCDGGCELFVIKLEEERECFVFDSFEAFLTAKELFDGKKGISCYRMKNKEKFFILFPALSAPPETWEYGEKMKHPPSDLFLKARCHKIENKTENGIQ